MSTTNKDEMFFKFCTILLVNSSMWRTWALSVAWSSLSASIWAARSSSVIWKWTLCLLSFLKQLLHLREDIGEVAWEEFWLHADVLRVQLRSWKHVREDFLKIAIEVILIQAGLCTWYRCLHMVAMVAGGTAKGVPCAFTIRGISLKDTVSLWHRINIYKVHQFYPLLERLEMR